MNIEEALDRIESFKLLKENWDSYGGTPPSIATIDKTKRLLKGLFVCPVSDGSIGITLGDEDIFITIGSDGEVLMEIFEISDST